ncbi:DUF3265 domain-containing protein [Vibrio anguillarum]|nr:DUF3265 domain-containing protein [Vibrio vulnificus]UJQ42995.1 DUF3265 domain-containing protein [Vibrio anguillarum]MCU8168193.1 DUF3265 domain-containing protein [Vibrio vulnificus]MCU8172751.1 DUF3265 domain-containing protein [Vibrio vulnificus]MCU8317667.1 DUF3265 domain-containing protein [Vibrio vulnificus]
MVCGSIGIACLTP